MIFPGHVAAAVLGHRYLKINLRVALVAGVLPDVVDKLLYYGWHAVPNTRTPMHTLWGWLGTSLLVLGVGWLWQRKRDWGMAWFVSYGLHIFCDSLLVGGNVPLLYPLLQYEMSSDAFPLAYLLNPRLWPWRSLIAEALLVAWAVLASARGRRWVQRLRMGWGAHAQ